MRPAVEEDFGEGKWSFGGEGKPDDVPVPLGAAAIQISKVLARADEHVGEYSFGGQADTLPAAPGLVVDGVGSIPVPITAAQAQQLISVCEKSPFGHNMDTKMDENVRKSWQLHPDHVRFENTAWHSGIERLSKIIADRLGYQDITLQCVLYKLLVYGEGGHFVKHQDTEKEDGMIATLVVQLPSSHEGGDLVIYRGGEVKHRHDFGKADGSAAYLPHYAVHYADAEHAVEKVTKGYRLALVYSICLPSVARHLEKIHDVPLSEALAGSISSLDAGDDSFALLLSHEYTEKSIQRMGVGALKGIDSVRFYALEEANTLVPAAKQLEFFLAQMEHNIEFKQNRSGDWEVKNRIQSINWYTKSGENLGRIVRSRATFNFLNPGQETLSAFWAPHGVNKEEGYMGNEGPTKDTKYASFAVIAWPIALHEEKALKLMPLDIAVETLRARKPVDAATLRKFIDEMGARRDAENKCTLGRREDISLKFCRLFCELAVDAGDPALVKAFFTAGEVSYGMGRPPAPVFCPGLDAFTDNVTLIPVLTNIVRTFDWQEIGEELLECLGASYRWPRTEDNSGDSSMEMALQIADGLDSEPAQDALLKMAVENAEELSAEDLCSSKAVGLLLKWASRKNDDATIDKVVDKLKQVDPSVLGPAVKMSLEYLRSVDTSDEKVGEVVARRIKWLETQIESLDKPFSWVMPDAEFSGSPKVEEFLRGPDTIMKVTKQVRKFKNFQDASNYAAKWTREKQVNASFEMEASSTNGDAVVTIQKTRKWFAECQHNLQLYKEELRQLRENYCGETGGSDKKRARME